LPIVGEFCGLRAGTPYGILKELANRFGLRLAALTRDPLGSLLMAGGQEDDCPAPPTKVADTVVP
jgi:hypothetical protein